MQTIIQAARAVSVLARSLRDRTERERALPPALLEALLEAKLFRLAISRGEGGLEAHPLDALCVYEELAGSEASVAWLVWNNTLPALMSRHLSAEARAGLLAAPRSILANSTRPTGKAARERDGFRISGRWALVSGCELADTFLLRAVVEPAELIMAYLPKSVCGVLDTWHAGGLRGTGSHDVVVEDAWVPAEHCVSFVQPLQLSAALYRMPFAATLSAGCASICLGIAKSALLALCELAQTKLQIDRALALRDQTALLARIARMQAEYDAARMLLHAAVGGVFDSCEAGAAASLEQRAQIWRAAQYAAAAAKRIVRVSYEAAGASALYEQCPLERAHRDLHAATQHVILQEFWLEDAGRVALGAAPLNPVFAS